MRGRGIILHYCLFWFLIRSFNLFIQFPSLPLYHFYLIIGIILFLFRLISLLIFHSSDLRPIPTPFFYQTTKSPFFSNFPANFPFLPRPFLSYPSHLSFFPNFPSLFPSYPEVIGFTAVSQP